jgi:hypothetical protein
MGDDVVPEKFYYLKHKRNFEVSSDISLMKDLPDKGLRSKRRSSAYIFQV